MKISVVHTVMWDADHFRRLESLGTVAYHHGYPATPAELAVRMGEAEIVVGAEVPFTAEVLARCPNLAMLSLWSTGYDCVDLAAARQRKIVVSNVPSYASHSVAEHSWAMALHLAKKLAEADRHVRARQYDWSAIQGLELHGKTVGIIGLGAIGARSAAIAQGFGCRVLVCTRHPDRVRPGLADIQFVALGELLAMSDLIFLHVPLNSETRGLLDRQAFACMQARPIVINTARGEVIDLEAALAALQSGRIRGLGLDVLWSEPPDWPNPALQTLLQMDQVVLSPHCGSHTPEAFDRLTNMCLDNVEAFLHGSPVNIVPT
jgi:phosphoglycerate dehydrogenase-like enzyme